MTSLNRWTCAWVLGLALSGFATGCGDDDGGGGSAGTGFSGSGGDGGSAGSAGTGGTAGIAGAGGSAGMAGLGGTGGSDVDSGIDDAGDTDAGDTLDAGGGTGGSAGTAGSGGTGGTGGTAGSGGTGGLGGCSTDCDDGVDCTVDTCENDTCVHSIDAGLCDMGQACVPGTGCVDGQVCTNPGDCDDNDPCTVNEMCNVGPGRCEWVVLDTDNDGQPSLACGGSDCDDGNANFRVGVVDGCDAIDADCDGTTDEDATCGNGGSCVSGQCVCGNLTECGGQCVNTDTNSEHCGGCGSSCGPAGTCVDGDCECNAPGAICDVTGPGGSGQTCVDTNTSQQHCGGCDMACDAGELCDTGHCVECGTAGQPCCALGSGGPGGMSGDGCPGNNLICSGARGTPFSECGCPEPYLLCTGQNADVCTNPQTDRNHCGTCDEMCVLGEHCMDGDCEPCGEIGETCCRIPFLNNGFVYNCRGTGACNLQNHICEE